MPLPFFRFAATPSVTAWWQAALDFLYPPLHPCPGCNRPDTFLDPARAGLCPACFESFPRIDPHTLPPGLRAPARYTGSAETLVKKLKYQENRYLAPVMARQMADCLADRPRPAEAWCVVPVPMHPRRLRQRGINQAHLLAREVAFMVEFSYQPDALRRHRNTAPMHRLSRSQRAGNVTDSIRINPQAAATLTDHHILLVDDVYTTGATVNACRRALETVPVRSVTALTFALADPAGPRNSGGRL